MCLLSFVLVSPAFAQSNYGTIRGTVTDPQHVAIPTVSVVVTSAATSAQRSVSGDEQGSFEVTGLLPGEYQMQVSAQGFATNTVSFRLEVAQQLTIETVMKVGSVRQDVEVSARVDVLHTTDASIGEVIESKAVHELPLNGRLLVDLMLTVPGAHVSHGAQTGDMNPLYWRPGRSAVTIGGNRPNANYFLLDGATNTDPTFNTLNLSPATSGT
jgi:hypothetical protein